MTKARTGFNSSPATIWRYGMELYADDRALALEKWREHRYTLNRTPDWARREIDTGKDLPPQFVDDKDWLEHTEFAVTYSGRLDGRVRSCREHPTWPMSPELVGCTDAQLARVAPNLRYRGWANNLRTQQSLADMEEERRVREDDPFIKALRERGLLAEQQKEGKE